MPSPDEYLLYITVLSFLKPPLAGVSDSDAQHLKDAFNIKTIGDLGKNKFFRAATLISQLNDAGAK